MPLGYRRMSTTLSGRRTHHKDGANSFAYRVIGVVVDVVGEVELVVEVLVDEVVVDVVEEDQPRWLTFLAGTYHWLALPATYAASAAPNGEIAPFLAKKGVRLQRSLQPAIECVEILPQLHGGIAGFSRRWCRGSAGMGGGDPAHPASAVAARARAGR